MLAVLTVAFGSACAALMGVEEGVLIDPETDGDGDVAVDRAAPNNNDDVISPPIDGAPPLQDANVDIDAAQCALLGAPTLVATTTSAPTKLSTDGEYVYWLQGQPSQKLMRASLVDCSTREIATGTISALGVDPQWIVWAAPTYRALKTTEVDVAPFTHPTGLSGQMAIRGEVYWVDSSNKEIAGCAQPCSATFVVVRLNTAPKLIATNATKIFFFGVHPDAGTTVDLWARGATPGLIGPFATNQNPTLLAANSSRAFWVNADGSAFSVVTTTTGNAPVGLGTVAGPRAIAADEMFVYVTTDTAILRAPVAGGALTSFIAGEAKPTSITLTGDNVVWANADGLTIRRQHR